MSVQDTNSGNGKVEKKTNSKGEKYLTGPNTQTLLLRVDNRQPSLADYGKRLFPTQEL